MSRASPKSARFLVILTRTLNWQNWQIGIFLLGYILLEIGFCEGGDHGVPITLSYPESASVRALCAVANTVVDKVVNAALVCNTLHFSNFN
jgi:hypothetical protein